MKNIKELIPGILCGVGLGLFLGFMKRQGMSTGFVIPLCVGVLVLMLDNILLRPVFHNYINKRLLREGMTAQARIDEIVKMAVHPKYYTVGPDGQQMLPADLYDIPAVYTLRLSYEIDGQTYTKDVATPAASPAEIRPFVIEEGAVIPVKYLDKHPDWIIVAVPEIMNRTVEAQRSMLFKGPTMAAVATGVYMVWLFTRYM